VKGRAARSWACVAFGATLALAGCATAHQRSAAERAADAEVGARVERALLEDPALYARHIDIDVRHGVVRLSGFVWSSDELFEAQRVAASVPGATGVVDRIELMVGGRSGAR
jgi:osmotically-inducible protein OsmY